MNSIANSHLRMGENQCEWYEKDLRHIKDKNPFLIEGNNKYYKCNTYVYTMFRVCQKPSRTVGV